MRWLAYQLIDFGHWLLSIAEADKSAERRERLRSQAQLGRNAQ